MAKPDSDPPPAPAAEFGERLADAAGDPEKHAKLSAAIEQLTPEEAQKVLDILEREMRKRSIQLWGYLAAGVVLIVGMIGVLIYWGSVPEGTSVAWTIPIPFLFVALILWGFGRWSNRTR